MAVLDIQETVGDLGTVRPARVIDFSEISHAVMLRAKDIALKEAQTNAREFRDTGALVDSLQARTTELSAEIGSPLPYAAVVESGRQAGASQPPVEALSDWAQRRGIDEEALYVIARAIGRRGIAGRFFMRRAYESLDKQMPTLIQQVARERGL